MNIVPCKQTNAIRAFGFAIELDGPLAMDQLLALQLAHEGPDDDLPRVQHHAGFRFEVAGGAPTQFQNAEMIGISFDRIDKVGNVESSFSVNNNLINFSGSAYTSWSEALSFFLATLDRFLGALPDFVGTPKNLILEYHNEYQILNHEKTWTTDLFSPASKLLPPYIYDLEGFWHVNTGYFSHADSAFPKILNNIAINYVVDTSAMQQKHILFSVVNHKMELPRPYETYRNIRANMESLFGRMHDENVNIKRALLSENMLTTIGMDAIK